MAVDPKSPTTELDRNAESFPQDPEAVKFLEREIELGNLGELPYVPPLIVPRYLVTYMKSSTTSQIRSATVVTITNQSPNPNWVMVSYFDVCSLVASSFWSIPSGCTIDFGTRPLPGELTFVEALPNNILNSHEGRAVVSSFLPEIGVSARVYYTLGQEDERLLAITDSKIVRYGQGNAGD